MNWKFMHVLFHLILSFHSYAWADENPQLTKFRVAPVAAIQDHGISYSTFLSWNPEYTFNSNLKLGLNLGITAFETKGRNDYVVTEYQVTSTYAFDSTYELELALGQQYWFINNGTAAICYSGIFAYNTNASTYNIEKYFIGVSYLDLPSQPTRQLKLGVGFLF